jgi:hypothetical protein
MSNRGEAILAPFRSWQGLVKAEQPTGAPINQACLRRFPAGLPPRWAAHYMAGGAPD